jgi:hypothetical protein
LDREKALIGEFHNRDWRAPLELLSRGLAIRVSFLVGAALVLFGVGYLAGAALSGDEEDAPLIETDERLGSPAIPESDAAGEDLALLPRFPGSVRSSFERGRSGELAITRTEHLVRAPLDDVRRFYRQAFSQNEWLVLEVSYDDETWRFRLRADNQEGVVQLQAFGEVVQISLEVSEPLTAVRRAGGDGAHF